jgi:hypothetical protein
MIDREADPSLRSDVLRDVLYEIEQMRFRRQEEVRERPHPQLKRFTQQELTDEVCPTYKNLLVGRSHRVPSRQSIMRIAEYLECSAQERNNLLLAARYLPDSLELEGVQLKQALEQARQLMGTLPYPAMIVTHTLHVEAVNEAFQRLFELPQLNALPQTQRHIFHFFFRHDLPMRVRSTFSDQAVSVWQAGVSRSIQLFKHSNVLYQFEPWYQKLVEQFCTVADFRNYWEQDLEVVDRQDGPSKLLLGRSATTDELLPMQLRHVRISVCSHMYPCIMALRPLDDAARDVFASLSSAEGSPFNAVSRR